MTKQKLKLIPMLTMVYNKNLKKKTFYIMRDLLSYSKGNRLMKQSVVSYSRNIRIERFFKAFHLATQKSIYSRNLKLKANKFRSKCLFIRWYARWLLVEETKMFRF